MSKIKACSTFLLEMISSKKIFTLICSGLNLFLICKLFYTFTLIKPTTTYKGEKELETIDLPEIVLCADPGFKLEVLEKYGYRTSSRYFFGDIGQAGNLFGWNGEAGVQNSSLEILEESLMFDRELRRKTIKFVGYAII